MIRYTLTCDKDHKFESWFQLGEAYDKLLAAGMVVCETCGSSDVSKSLTIVPGIPKKGRELTSEGPSELEKMREDVEKNSEYVGTSFAVRAKDIQLDQRLPRLRRNPPFRLKRRRSRRP